MKIQRILIKGVLIKKKKIKFWRTCELRFDRRKVGSDVGENSMNLHNPILW